jgi:transposase-like protein
METNLENLASLVSEHRRENNRSRYPATVWEKILVLRKDHTVAELSRATGINVTQIYKQTGKRRSKPLFREVKLVAPAAVVTAAVVKAIVVELRRGDGAELRLKIELSARELSNLFAEFLGC